MDVLFLVLLLDLGDGDGTLPFFGRRNQNRITDNCSLPVRLAKTFITKGAESAAQKDARRQTDGL